MRKDWVSFIHVFCKLGRRALYEKSSDFLKNIWILFIFCNILCTTYFSCNTIKNKVTIRKILLYTKYGALNEPVGGRHRQHYWSGYGFFSHKDSYIKKEGEMAIFFITQCGGLQVYNNALVQNGNSNVSGLSRLFGLTLIRGIEFNTVVPLFISQKLWIFNWIWQMLFQYT